MRSGATALPRRSSWALSTLRSADIEPILFGPATIDAHGVRLVETTESIDMDDHAVEAVRSKVDSSLVRAVRAVADGEADAVISAGNTGAMLAASLLHIRRIPGVHRPGIAVVIPTKPGRSVLIDAGANADARPEHLVQFAHMGAVFAEEILGVPNPDVRLLSIGEEPEKGNQLTLEAHELLRSAAGFASAGTPRVERCSKATPTSSSPTGSRGTLR